MRILLISGSTRAGSTNSATLDTLRANAPDGVEALRYDGLTSLPHFNPDDDIEPLPLAVVDLREQLAAVDAVVFSTPEYAGALPGSLKNLLDWTVGDSASSGKLVAWINTSATGGAAGAHQELRTVVTYTDWSVVDEACATIPVTRRDIDNGEISDPDIRRQIAAVVDRLAAAVRRRP